MNNFSLIDLEQQRAVSGDAWLEFLRVPSNTLSMGLYVLPAGGVDTQQPHTEDEVYYVVRGRGKLCVEGEDQEVAAGSIIFVAARVEHYFHGIEEELSILVFFAPAEYANRQ
jgi:quercetin dioxygenase-like cupin family protein